MKKFTEKFEEDEDFLSACTQVIDDKGKIVFCVSICNDCPEDHTFGRDLIDCRKVAELLNAAYAKGFEDGLKQKM